MLALVMRGNRAKVASRRAIESEDTIGDSLRVLSSSSGSAMARLRIATSPQARDGEIERARVNTGEPERKRRGPMASDASTPRATQYSSNSRSCDLRRNF